MQCILFIKKNRKIILTLKSKFIFQARKRKEMLDQMEDKLKAVNLK